MLAKSNGKELIKINLKDISKIFAPTPILKEIIELYNTCEEIELSKLVETLEKDLVLSMTILKLANSAYYGSSQQVSTLSRAIELIGILETRNIALFHALVSQHKTYTFPPNFNYKDFWLHGLITANIAKELHPLLNSNLERDAIYLSGLFHDIGWLIVATLHTDKYDLILEHDQSLSGNSIPIHCRIGMLLSKLWKLPEPITHTILFHERPHLSKKYKEDAIIINTASCLADALKLSDGSSISDTSNIDFHKKLTDVNIEMDKIKLKISKLLVYIQNLIACLNV